MANRPQLTISLLISNRIETIPRCLDSLKPIMEAIPCELILIDTSKNPEVHNLLLQYTDQVYEFEWCNDFAKARNEGVKRSHGEWFMFLDDDEWFVDFEEIITFFASGEYHNYAFANYKVRNFLDKGFNYYEDGWVSRLVRLEEDTHFVSKIHEYFTPVRGGQKDLNAMVGHTGYIFESSEERKAHFERNHALLQNMITEEPDNIRWWIQLAQEYSYSGEHERLIEYSAECLKKLETIDAPYINAERGVFHAGFVTGCIRAKRYNDSIEHAKSVLNDYRTGWILEAMMHLRLAESYLCLGEIDESEIEIREYFHMLESTNFDDASIKQQMGVFLAGEAFGKNSKEIAYAILICCALEKGNTSVLKECYEKLGWKNPVVYTLQGIEKYLAKAMWNLPYESIFAKVFIDAFNRDNLRIAIRKEVSLQEQRELSIFQKQVYELSETMQHIIDGPEEEILEYYSDLQKYVQATSEWYNFLEVEGLLDYLGEEIPDYMQAAVDIADYLELESTERLTAFGKLKSAVDKFPEFAKGIGQFLERYKELEEQRVAQRGSEMEALRMQVITQVKVMIENNQYEGARQIINQLNTMFPGDKEIMELEKELQ